MSRPLGPVDALCVVWDGLRRCDATPAYRVHMACETCGPTEQGLLCQGHTAALRADGYVRWCCRVCRTDYPPETGERIVTVTSISGRPRAAGRAPAHDSGAPPCASSLDAPPSAMAAPVRPTVPPRTASGRPRAPRQ